MTIMLLVIALLAWASLFTDKSLIPDKRTFARTLLRWSRNKALPGWARDKFFLSAFYLQPIMGGAEPQTGTRGTKFSDATEGSLPRDVADRINMLQPDDAPYLALTNALKQKKSSDEAKYEWFEDQLLPNVIVCSGTAGTGTTINVVTGTGKRVVADLLLVAPSGETILITTVATDALTVTRSMGAVAAYSLVDGDQLVILGPAMAEGSDIPTARYTQKANKTNFIQIFRTPTSLTDVQGMVKSYGENDRTFQRMKAAIQHKRDIEHMLLFGDKFEDTSGTQTRRGSGGLLNTISTNVTDVGGVITESEFESVIRTVMRYTPLVKGGSKTMFCSPIYVSAINFWAKGQLRITSNEKVYGLNIGVYRSGHGDINIIRHWLLADFTEFTKYAFIVEPGNLKYRFLINGGDTKLHTDVQPDTSATFVDEYRSYVGGQTEQEITHAILKGCTGYAA